MRHKRAVALQVILVFFGVAVLGFLLWEPHVEGRNAHATFWQVYLHDPFLVYAYASSIAFFLALYQAVALLGFLAQGPAASQRAVRALRIIRDCGVALLLLLLGAEGYFLLVQRTREDNAGGVMLGLLLMLVAAAMTLGAVAWERRLRVR